MLKNFGFWLLVFIFTANIVLGFTYNFYDFWYFDKILHFLGGFGVYLAVKQYFGKTIKNASWFDSALLLVSLSVFVGVLWEFAEFALANLWLTRPGEVELIGDLRDTIDDLAMDTLGAVIASILHFFRQRKA